MPYIKRERREAIDVMINELIFEDHVSVPGELNYTISRLCHEYIHKLGKNDRLRYSHLTDQ